MWVNVKFVNGSMTTHKLYASKIMPVEMFKRMISSEEGTPFNKLKLFFRGKVLVDSLQDEDGNFASTTLFDYKINVCDTIQVTVMQDDVNNASARQSKENDIPKSSVSSVKEESSSPNKIFESVQSNFFQVGELVDAKTEGVWMEAKVFGIKRDQNAALTNSSNKINLVQNKALRLKDGDGLLYLVEFENGTHASLPLKGIRPQARHKIPFEDVKIGSKIMVNYNTDEPDRIGYWYDFQVTGIISKRTKKRVKGTVFLGVGDTTLNDQEIKYVDDIYKIEETVPICDRDSSQKKLMMEGPDVKRMKKPDCDHCYDKPNISCKECSCSFCGGKDEPEQQIMCDECQYFFHLGCLVPPLKEVPADDWYCPECKNDDEIETPGQKLKRKLKKSSSDSTRDWGRGMACAGRSKECTIVEKNHFGPIPGIEVGMAWQFRSLVSDAGVHRPLVSGIHGREKEGAFSVCLSGGYEDDTDNGDEFFYTGSGGRNLKGNKRTAPQSFDQKLTKMNKALAQNCAAPMDIVNGAKAEDWTIGKPIRVVRGHKGHKTSPYSPTNGFRYDGIYKVVKYWPEMGLSGFKVWRYLFRRDDATPAPWTDEGKRRIEELGIVMELVDGDVQGISVDNIITSKRRQTGSTTPKSTKKRKRNEELDSNKPLKKVKKDSDQKMVKAFVLPQICHTMIEEDEQNKKIWESCLEFCKEGKVKFLEKVKDEFKCVICQDIVAHPITLECNHNICKKCLELSFKNELYQCPMCRLPLKQDYKLVVNGYLKEVLNVLFKWYDEGR